MSNQEARFLLSCNKVTQFPHHNFPEVAIIGRSNVGKSSLINAMTNRKLLAKVSKTPGATRTINFFQFTDKIVLVDLPGYGYANVPESLKAGWEKLILSYLETREQLKLCIVLIDGKVGFKASDFAVINLLRNYARNFAIVFTKTEKLSEQDKQKLIVSAINNVPEFDSSNSLLTSSKNKNGIKQLVSFIFNHENIK